MQLLDDPVLNSLVGAQHVWALNHPSIKRFQPAIAPFVSGQGPLDELQDAVEPDEEIVFVGGLHHPISAAFTCINVMNVNQMLYEGTAHQSSLDPRIVPLSAMHAKDMLNLTELAFPGYFRRETYKLGGYYGIFSDGMLVAMAGERMHVGTCRELSAICTHPDYRGRGYAQSLSEHLTQKILNEGLIPFLHVGESNAAAIKLYERLGFRFRRSLSVHRYQLQGPG